MAKKYARGVVPGMISRAIASSPIGENYVMLDAADEEDSLALLHERIDEFSFMPLNGNRRLYCAVFVVEEFDAPSKKDIKEELDKLKSEMTDSVK